MASRSGEGAHKMMPPTEGARRLDAYYQNLYTSEPDFSQLGRQDSAFGALYVLFWLSRSAALI